MNVIPKNVPRCKLKSGCTDVTHVFLNGRDYEDGGQNPRSSPKAEPRVMPQRSVYLH